MWQMLFILRYNVLFFLVDDIYIEVEECINVVDDIYIEVEECINVVGRLYC